MAKPKANEIICPVCHNDPAKKTVTITTGRTKIVKNCGKCLGVGRIPKGK